MVFGSQGNQISVMGMATSGSYFATYMAHYKIKEYLAQVHGGNMLSGQPVVKSLDTVVTCLIGNQLLREKLYRPLYLRVRSATLRILVLDQTHL